MRYMGIISKQGVEKIIPNKESKVFSVYNEALDQKKLYFEVDLSSVQVSKIKDLIKQEKMKAALRIIKKNDVKVPLYMSFKFSWIAG